MESSLKVKMQDELETYGLRSISSIKRIIDKMEEAGDREGLEWAIKTLEEMGSEQALTMAKNALRMI